MVSVAVVVALAAAIPAFASGGGAGHPAAGVTPVVAPLHGQRAPARPPPTRSLVAAGRSAP